MAQLKNKTIHTQNGYYQLSRDNMKRFSLLSNNEVMGFEIIQAIFFTIA
jgi:hypothetical protein